MLGGTALGYEGLIFCEVGNKSLVSEAGEILRNKYPQAPFIVLYAVGSGKIICSLRAGCLDIHLGELAQKYGGGGHPKAAGFVVNGLYNLVTNYNLY